MDQIPGNYSLCSNQVNNKLNAIFLSLNEMIIIDGFSNGILDSSMEKFIDSMILKKINSLISEHRNSFVPSKNNVGPDNLVNSDYLRWSKNHFRNKVLHSLFRRTKKTSQQITASDINHFIALLNYFRIVQLPSTRGYWSPKPHYGCPTIPFVVLME